MTEHHLENQLKELEKLKHQHPTKAMNMMKADNSTLFPLDFLAVSVFKRSMSLIDGFCTLIKNKNFICAAPLVRLQLDNALRFFATTLVKEPHKLANAFIEGVPIKHFKDENTGEKLMDFYLVKKLSSLGEQFKWISDLYKSSSGYIHLSVKHFFNSTNTKSNESMKFETVIGAYDNFITIEDKINASKSMIDTTKVVLFLLDSWTFNKNNPGLRQKLESKKS